MNARIDHSNYEAWLLDRSEGNLTPDQERELDAFLALHPELSPEEGELPTLNAFHAALPAAIKGSLKRSLPPTAMPDEANINDHLVARLEGDLTPVQLDALRVYLIEHPEHQRAERIYALAKVVPEAMAYAEKRSLQHHFPPTGLPAHGNLNDFLVARLEGDLTREQDRALAAFLATDRSAQKVWALMSATRVQATTIAYPDKSALKKGGRVIAIGATNWTIRLAAAASIAAVIGLGLWFLLQRAPDAEQVAEKPKEVKAEQPAVKQPVEVVRPDTSEENSDPSAVPDNAPMKQGRENGMNNAPLHEPAPRIAVPVEREESLPMAQERQVVPNVEHPRNVPVNVAVPEVPRAPYEGLAALPTTTPNKEATVGELLAATVRERLLEQPARETDPLDGDDAVAAVDKGLKAVGGERAGLAVERKADGGVRGFNLRLGRNLAISASR